MGSTSADALAKVTETMNPGGHPSRQDNGRLSPGVRRGRRLAITVIAAGQGCFANPKACAPAQTFDLNRGLALVNRGRFADTRRYDHGMGAVGSVRGRSHWPTHSNRSDGPVAESMTTSVEDVIGPLDDVEQDVRSLATVGCLDPATCNNILKLHYSQELRTLLRTNRMIFAAHAAPSPYFESRPQPRSIAVLLFHGHLDMVYSNSASTLYERRLVRRHPI